MNEIASTISNLAFQQSPDNNSLKSQNQTGKRSFQEVMESGNNQQSPNSTSTVQSVGQIDNQSSTGVSGAGLEQKRVQLEQNITQLGPNPNETNPLNVLSEMLHSKTRIGVLREAAQGIQKAPNGTQIMSRITQVENEYNSIEAMMKSNKELSQGELLGLQARLYQVSQHIEVMSKVVDQLTGGIKTVLNTNI